MPRSRTHVGPHKFRKLLFSQIFTVWRKPSGGDSTEFPDGTAPRARLTRWLQASPAWGVLRLPPRVLRDTWRLVLFPHSSERCSGQPGTLSHGGSQGSMSLTSWTRDRNRLGSSRLPPAPRQWAFFGCLPTQQETGVSKKVMECGPPWPSRACTFPSRDSGNEASRKRR